MDNYDREKMYKRHVSIYMEANPNPNSLKFAANNMLLKPREFFDFDNIADARGSGFAEELFELPGVERVFIMSNFVTVTKSEDMSWEDLREPIKSSMTSWLSEEKPIISEEAKKSVDTRDSGEIGEKIKAILAEYIQPAVEQDGGAISFHSFDKGKVTVLLQGACSGCPSATITLKHGIEKLLKGMMPEVESVIAYSPETF